MIKNMRTSMMLIVDRPMNKHGPVLQYCISCSHEQVQQFYAGSTTVE